jgi:hypothetical protein
MPKATPRSFISYTYIYTRMIHSCRHIYGCTMDSTGQCRDVGMSLPVSSTSGIFASTGNLHIHIHLQIIHYVYQNVRVVWVSRYTKVHISVLSYHIHELWSIITPVFCWRNHPFITVLVDVPHICSTTFPLEERHFLWLYPYYFFHIVHIVFPFVVDIFFP